jgi:FkbM family methyltransferase
MTYYWDPKFLQHLQTTDVKCIVEVGARYGDETIMLSKIFDKPRIYSFECNPNTIDRCFSNLANYPTINFFPHGLGKDEEILPFYSYTQDNDGASSFYKRIDSDFTQKITGNILVRKLESMITEENITCIDLLCMDTQGSEIDILKGAGRYLSRINYIIMEEPKPVINTHFLPEGVHSKYIGTPTSLEIKEFMNKNNFTEIERIGENAVEDNVMYKQNR